MTQTELLLEFWNCTSDYIAQRERAAAAEQLLLLVQDQGWSDAQLQQLADADHWLAQALDLVSESDADDAASDSELDS